MRYKLTLEKYTQVIKARMDFPMASQRAIGRITELSHATVGKVLRKERGITSKSKGKPICSYTANKNREVY